MTINQLELFLNASRTLNFTRTGEQFYISQSAVTQQIRNLEEELEVTLFRRDKKKLSLTDAGQLFVKEAQSLIDHTQEAISRVRAMQQGETGNLNIGYLATLDTGELPDVIYKFHAKYPGVHLNLTRDNALNLYRDFKLGKYDLIFNTFTDEFVYEDVVTIPLRSFGFVVCMPANHRLANRSVIRQKDLLNDKIIAQYPGTDAHSTNGFFQRTLMPELFDNIIAVENDTPAAAIMVAAGLGIAILPDIGVDEFKHHLVTVPLDTSGFQISIMMYYRKDHHNTAIDHFVNESQLYNLNAQISSEQTYL